jgi:hypothetical protein
MRTQGITNVYYYIPFVCNYSGAKIVEFVERKSHFIHAYRRFVARIDGVHPRKLRTDKGGEFMSTELKELLELELHFVHHQTCAVDEHYSIGTSENAVGRLRETSIALLLQANLPSKFWPCAIHIYISTVKLRKLMFVGGHVSLSPGCIHATDRAAGAIVISIVARHASRARGRVALLLPVIGRVQCNAASWVVKRRSEE